MKHSRSKLGLGFTLSAALVFATACGPDAIATSTAPDLAVAADHIPGTDFGHVEVCKAGVGSGSFTVVPAGTVDGTITMPGPFTLAAGECVEVADVNLVPGINTIVEVSITETPDPGTVLTGVEVFESFIGGSQTFAIMNGDMVTAGDDGRVTVTFTNEAEPPPPPPGIEGCTPGYYKNLKKHLGDWSADPNAPVSSLFSEASNVSAAVGNATLHEGLKFKGGNTFEKKSRILLRAAIAAWLNAAGPDVDYPMTADMVVSEVNAALASGDSNTVLALARQLDDFNNLGCPL